LAKRVSYKSDKRKKELLRQKKQEEKRQRRFKKDTTEKYDSDLTIPDTQIKE
jgi:uncharacterized protein YpuA (DUF1002 family)